MRISAIYTCMILVAVILVLIAHGFVSREFYKAAAMKGWGEKKYFWLPFLAWGAGYLLIIALPDRVFGAVAAVECDDLPEL